MADNSVRGGIAYLSVDGEVMEIKGNWTYNLGYPKNEGIVGTNAIPGFKSMVQIPYLEGSITDRGDLDLSELMTVRGATITLLLANGKTGVWRNAWWAGDGNISTEEGEIEARFEARSAEEIVNA